MPLYVSELFRGVLKEVVAVAARRAPEARTREEADREGLSGGWAWAALDVGEGVVV